jgi:hypothetical protein
MDKLTVHHPAIAAFTDFWKPEKTGHRYHTNHVWIDDNGSLHATDGDALFVLHKTGIPSGYYRPVKDGREWIMVTDNEMQKEGERFYPNCKALTEKNTDDFPFKISDEKINRSNKKSKLFAASILLADIVRNQNFKEGSINISYLIPVVCMVKTIGYPNSPMVKLSGNSFDLFVMPIRR